MARRLDSNLKRMIFVDLTCEPIKIRGRLEILDHKLKAVAEVMRPSDRAAESGDVKFQGLVRVIFNEGITLAAGARMFHECTAAIGYKTGGGDFGHRLAMRMATGYLPCKNGRKAKCIAHLLSLIPTGWTEMLGSVPYDAAFRTMTQQYGIGPWIAGAYLARYHPGARHAGRWVAGDVAVHKTIQMLFQTTGLDGVPIDDPDAWAERHLGPESAHEFLLFQSFDKLWKRDRALAEKVLMETMSESEEAGGRKARVCAVYAKRFPERMARTRVEDQYDEEARRRWALAVASATAGRRARRVCVWGEYDQVASRDAGTEEPEAKRRC
jgi:hypothetical protein